MTARWIERERAAHDADLASPQRFPLTGDGEFTGKLTKRHWQGEMFEHEFRTKQIAARHLMMSRYRDWERTKR